MFKAVFLITFALATFALPAFAQQDDAAAGFSTTLVSELSYDDNILRQQDNKLASRILLVNPGLDYLLERGGSTVGAGYDFSHYTYLDSRADDYDSHAINLNLSQLLGRAHKVSLQGNLLYSSEGRGVGFNEGQTALALSEPTDISTKGLVGNYQIGADDARLRLVANLGARSTDRDSPTIINDSRDYREDLLGGQILYKLGWRTDLVGEVRKRMVSYERNPVLADGTEQSLDSTETQTLLGIDLRATAKTTGKLRAGSTRRDFRWKSAQWDGAAPEEPAAEAPVPAPVVAAAPQNTGSDLFWEITGVWAPRTYSTFTLSSTVSTREAVSVGFFIRSQDHRLAWSHSWNAWAQSEIDLNFGTDEYIGGGRTDKRRAVNLRLLYTFDESTNLGLGVRHQELLSQDATLGFDKWVYYLFFNWSDKLAGEQ
jgi:hypothetical protein